ncbi:protein kinase family protein [Virgibacillus xinjiangensis]|uniref:Protein kinase family protein n=1 Tax=Virgibacillus xinjiangensis TaxID=393090 RepID=A0ABV7CX82_9BACI
MNEAWKRQAIDLSPGMKIRGKWHGRTYMIKQRLGAGAIGTVYLCDSEGESVAMKVSRKGTSLAMEVNVLKSLNKVQGNPLGPYLMDVDDWHPPGGDTYTFYVMEYLQGKSLSEFVARNGSSWIGVLMLQLLDDLHRLHQSGWVYGDLKPENLLVLDKPRRVRWVDVGGTTKVGRAIKEYTEFYDRGYWGLGSRKAEPGYDLFALAMVFLNIYYPKKFEKGSDSAKTLLRKINNIPDLQPYRQPLRKAVLGQYISSATMMKDVASIVKGQQPNRRRPARKEHSSPLAENSLIGLIAVIYYFFSLLL